MDMENQDYLIPLNGLASGRKEFLWNAGKMFFEDFGNEEMLDADLEIEAEAEKSGKEVHVDCRISGTVTVLCDRCMDELVLPVDTEAKISVRYGEAPDEIPEEGEADGDREIVWIGTMETELDMRQLIYDYVCLSLPMQRFHEDGECNPATVEVLSHGIKVSGEHPSGNPFEALQGIFGDNDDNNN